MTATLEETETTETNEAALDAMFAAIDELNDSTARSVIQYLPDEVDADVPLPEEVNDDPREALKSVARKHPGAVAAAAAALALAMILADILSVF